MKSRAGKAFAAALMHLIFGAVNAVAWFATWLALALWLARGDAELGDAIKRYGKAEDQAANAALFSGHPKETISSHAGRWLAYAAENPADDIPVPWWVYAVAWLTGLFEKNHVLKAIEEPFKGLPLNTN